MLKGDASPLKCLAAGRDSRKMVSACLLGVRCTWDGKVHHRNGKVMELSRRETIIPVCPEQLGGLSTPREAQEIERGSGDDVLDGKCRVVNRVGQDVTSQFIAGANEALRIARRYNIKDFIGKSKSPSCGCGLIYDGSFSKRLTKGDGVTVALLKRNGVKVMSENGVSL